MPKSDGDFPLFMFFLRPCLYRGYMEYIHGIDAVKTGDIVWVFFFFRFVSTASSSSPSSPSFSLFLPSPNFRRWATKNGDMMMITMVVTKIPSKPIFSTSASVAATYPSTAACYLSKLPPHVQLSLLSVATHILFCFRY